MRPDFLDRYSRLTSPIHKISAGTKTFAALLFIAVTVLNPFSVREYFIGLALFLLIVAVLTRIPFSFLIRRIVFLEPFVLGTAALSLFQPNGEIIFLTIVVRSTLCLIIVLLLSNTTPFASLLDVLKAVRVPPVLITILALMYRYLFVIVDEAERMKRARSSRSFNLPRFQLWKSLGTLLGQLFVRSTERGERIYTAMLSRGWR